MEQNSSNPPLATVSYSYPTAGGQAPMVFSTPQGGVRQRYQHNYVRGVSITLIVLGWLCFLAQFAEIFLIRRSGVVGAGIWSGFFFITTGTLGVISSKARTTCWIVTFLVMSVIGAILSIVPLTAGAIGWAVGDYSYRYRYGYGYDNTYVHRNAANNAMNAIMMLAGIAVGILMIVSSVFACHGLCPDSTSRRNVIVPGQVQYVTGHNGQQQMIIMSMPQTMPQPVPGPNQFQASDQPHTGQAMASVPAPVQPTDPTDYGHEVNPPQYEEKTTSG